MRVQLLELALLQDDDAQTRENLDDIKRIEGGETGGMDWSFGEALRLIHDGRKGKKEAFDKARHLLTVAGAQRPTWHPILQTRAELDELQGRPDQAIANYRLALDLGCRDPQAMRKLIILLSQAHRYNEVEQVLQRMQKLNGATDELVRYYITNSYNRRELRTAEYLIRKIVASNSTNYRDHLWLGQIVSSGGQSPEDAEKAFRRAVALAPDQPEAWVNLVRHLVGTGQYLQAKAEIDNASKALPEEKSALTLALCCELVGFRQDAADHYKNAVERQPTAQAIRAAADFNARVGRIVEAEALYRVIHERKVLANEQDATAARRGLALALVRQNQPRKVAQALELVGLRSDENGIVPDHVIAETAEEQLIQAKVLGSVNHHRLRARAIALLDTLQQRNALTADDQFFLARLWMLQGNDAVTWPKARALLKSVALHNPRNERYLGFTAQQMIQQKEFTDADQYIAKLEQLERDRKMAAGGFGSIELRAKLLAMRGLGTQAVALLTVYAEQPGALPIRKLLLADLQGRLGNFQAAIDLCAQVRQTPALFHEANNAAIALLRDNKPGADQATKLEHWQRANASRVETFLREVAQKDPKDIPSRMFLAELLELQGNYGEVEKLCHDARKMDDTQIVALNNLAWLLGQSPARAAEALTLINRAIKTHGPRPELLDTRAIVQLNLGNAEQALRDLERVVNEAPTPTRLFHLARAHERLKNVESAVAMLRQATETGLTLQQVHPVEQAEYQRVTAELRPTGRE